jgi:hypothetical protein
LEKQKNKTTLGLNKQGFSTEKEVVEMSNDSPYGLAAAVFSRDLDKCERVGRQLRVGIVWKNCCQPAFVQAPWGELELYYIIHILFTVFVKCII